MFDMDGYFDGDDICAICGEAFYGDADYLREYTTYSQGDKVHVDCLRKEIEKYRMENHKEKKVTKKKDKKPKETRPYYKATLDQMRAPIFEQLDKEFGLVLPMSIRALKKDILPNTDFEVVRYNYKDFKVYDLKEILTAINKKEVLPEEDCKEHTNILKFYKVHHGRKKTSTITIDSDGCDITTWVTSPHKNEDRWKQDYCSLTLPELEQIINKIKEHKGDK